MKMRHAQDLGPVLVDLGVDAPLDRDLHRLVAAGVVQDRAAQVEGEDLVGPHAVLARPRARRQQHDVAVGNPDRDMAEKADRALQPDDPAQDRELAPQFPFRVRRPAPRRERTYSQWVRSII